MIHQHMELWPEYSLYHWYPLTTPLFAYSCSSCTRMVAHTDLLYGNPYTWGKARVFHDICMEWLMCLQIANTHL